MRWIMKVLNKNTRNSSVKKDFNENHTRMQDGKWPFELKRLEIDEQGSILWCKYDKICKPKPQGSILCSTRIDPYKKEKSWGNIPLRIDSFLSAMILFLRFSGYGNLDFCVKDRSFKHRQHFINQRHNFFEMKRFLGLRNVFSSD